MQVHSRPEINQPTESEIRSMLAEIEFLTSRGAEIETLKEKLRWLMDGYKISAPVINSGARLFRGRIVDGKPIYLRELSAPPSSCVKTYQRCNRAMQSMFYCSWAVNIPLHERRISKGHLVALSEWRTTND